MEFQELDYLLNKAETTLKNVRKLAYSCLRKIGIDPKSWKEKAYLTRRTNGISEYAALEIYTITKRRVIGLGPLDKFSRHKLYAIMEKRFGCTKDEVDALLIYRFIKNYYDKLEEARHHLKFFFEIMEYINGLEGVSIDSLIESLKTNSRRSEIVFEYIYY